MRVRLPCGADVKLSEGVKPTPDTMFALNNMFEAIQKSVLKQDSIRTLLGRCLVLAGPGQSELKDTLEELWELVCQEH